MLEPMSTGVRNTQLTSFIKLVTSAHSLDFQSHFPHLWFKGNNFPTIWSYRKELDKSKFLMQYLSHSKLSIKASRFPIADEKLQVTAVRYNRRTLSKQNDSNQRRGTDSVPVPIWVSLRSLVLNENSVNSVVSISVSIQGN